MPDQALAAVRQLQVAHAGQIGLGLDLDGLGQQLAGAGSQNIGQGIVNRVGLTKADNVGSLGHDVSLSEEVLAGSSPASIRRLSHTVITQIPP